MLRFLLVLICVFAFSGAVMADEESTVKSYDDYILIKYIPAYGEFVKKSSVRELKATSSTTQVKADGSIMGTNEALKKFHDDMKAMKEQGVSGRTYPDSRYWRIEVSYMGDVVALENGVSKDSTDLSEHEKLWWALQENVFKYVTKNIAP